MKKLISLFALLAFCAVGAGAIAIQKDDPSVSFDGKTFYLRYSEGSSQMWLNEYLPQGSTLGNYTYMFAVRSYDGNPSLTPQQMGSAVITNLLRSRPNTNYSFFPSGKDTGLKFLITDGKVWEFNLFRFTVKDGMPISLQFVYRESVSAEAKMEKNLQRQEEWARKLMSLPVPSVVRSVKK